MTLDEAVKIAKIVGTADSGCDQCVSALVRQLSAAFPEFVWQVQDDFVVEDFQPRIPVTVSEAAFTATSGGPIAEPINLADRRAPVAYTIRVLHHWNDALEVFIEDVSDDERSKSSVADALGRAAIQCGSLPTADAMHKVLLARVDALMSAEAGTPEADELSRLADVVAAYEAVRWPPSTPTAR
jgi:hypothetical protein